MKILDGGSDAGRCNLVLVSEGYRTTDMPAFRKHAAELVRVIEAEAWYRPGLLNVHTLEVTSVEPGNWLQPGRGSRDTAFRFELGKDGAVARLISGDDAAVREAIEEMVIDSPPRHILEVVRGEIVTNCPHHIGVLCNSRYHGGWGGPAGRMFWVCAGASNWTDTALHELGHSLFNLRDEYSDDTGKRRVWTYPEPENPNVTTDPTGRKWAHITDTVHEGAARYDKGIYRAFPRCRMRNVGPFCLVCQDAIVRKLEGYLEELPSEEVAEATERRWPAVGQGSITIQVAAWGKYAHTSKVFPDDIAGIKAASEWLLKRKFG